MFFAVILRNLNDQLHVVKVHTETINLIGDYCLGVFLSMALMTLKLWELADLALRMIVILMSQVIFMIVYNIIVAFPVWGNPMMRLLCVPAWPVMVWVLRQTRWRI